MIIVSLLCFSALIGVLLYFANQYKRPLRLRQCLILSAWALVSLQGYPLVASGEEYDRDYRDYREYRGYDRYYRDYREPNGGYRDYSDYRRYAERNYGKDSGRYSERNYDGGYSREYGRAPTPNNARTKAGKTKVGNELVPSIYASCYRSQRTSVANYGMSENVIMDYCNCASKNMVGRLSYEDFKLLDKLQGTGSLPPHELQQKMEFITMTCRKSSTDKTSSSDLPSNLEAMDQSTNQNRQSR